MKSSSQAAFNSGRGWFVYQGNYITIHSISTIAKHQRTKTKEADRSYFTAKLLSQQIEISNFPLK